MPKNKRARSASSSSDTSVHDSPPPAKKEKKSAKGNESGDGPVRKNGEVIWNITSNKMVKVRSFKGKTYIDIREYYDKDGEMLPTKKGISLTPENYHTFKQLIKEIDEEINR